MNNRERLLVALTALNAMDGVLSFWTIGMFGIARESNPFMEALINLHPVAFLLYKLLCVPVLLYFLIEDGLAVKVGMVFAAIYTCIVAMNLWIMFDTFVLGSL